MSPRGPSIREADAEILSLGKARVPVRRIAQTLGCDRRRIRTILAREGVPPCTLSEARKQHSGPNKGKTLSLAHREKFRIAKLGIKRAPDVVARMAATMRTAAARGAAHYLWKGGITPDDKKQRRSPEYKIWRDAVYKRDNYTCLLCATQGGVLHPDHIKPWSLFPELRFDVSNGRTLCAPCHRKTPTYGVNLVRLSKTS